MYDDGTRDRLRTKQDRLILLAHKLKLADFLHISADEPSSPTIAQLEYYIWPAWEGVIDTAIGYLERRAIDYMER